MEDVQQEIAVMSSSHCPQLTEYYTSFVSENQLWIIMEHLEAGSLSDVMKVSSSSSSSRSINSSTITSININCNIKGNTKITTH
jgi:serine/threonine protein kinase